MPPPPPPPPPMLTYIILVQGVSRHIIFTVADCVIVQCLFHIIVQWYQLKE